MVHEARIGLDGSIVEVTVTLGLTEHEAGVLVAALQGYLLSSIEESDRGTAIALLGVLQAQLPPSWGLGEEG